MFELLETEMFKILVFKYATQCRILNSQGFGEKYCLMYKVEGMTLLPCKWRQKSPPNSSVY
jgi:hypothetical protein